MRIASQAGAAAHRVKGVYYGWWLVALTGLTMTIATVPLYHAMTVWSVALEAHFGWTRTQLGWALTLTRIEGGLMGPIEGYLTDKLGARRMVLMGLLILGVGFLIFWRVDNLWMFYVAFVVMALGQGLGSWLPLMTGLNNWFTQRRATAMGWANVGSRLGALVLVPAIAWAVNPDQDRLGWQLTALVMAVVTLALAFPISRAIRDRPPTTPAPRRPVASTSPAGAAQAATATAPAVSNDLSASQAIRTPGLLAHLLRPRFHLDGDSGDNDPLGSAVEGQGIRR